MQQGFKSRWVRGLAIGVPVLLGLTAAQARDGVGVSVAVPEGRAPVLVVPAPVVVHAAVTVPTRAVQVAGSPAAQAAPHGPGRPQDAGSAQGRGWQRKPGGSAFWQYEAAPPGGAVVVQASPQVWVR